MTFQEAMPSQALRIFDLLFLRKTPDLIIDMKTMKSILAMTVLANASLAMAEINKTETIASEVLKNPVFTVQAPEARPYKSTMNLDIAELIKIEYLRSAPSHCGVIPAEMTYKDSSGAVNVVEYLYPDTSGCTD